MFQHTLVGEVNLRDMVLCVLYSDIALCSNILLYLRCHLLSEVYEFILFSRNVIPAKTAFRCNIGSISTA